MKLGLGFGACGELVQKKIEKVLKKLEYETIAWLVIGVVHDVNILCGEDGA